MSNLINENNVLFAEYLKSLILELPAKAMYAASKELFMGSVRLTVQDSGEAAASWNFGFAPGEYITGQDTNPVVGVRGEKRSQTGGEGAVIAMMTAEFQAIVPSYEVFLATETAYITNSVSGKHEKNAMTFEAYKYSVIDAKLAAESAIQGFGNVL